MTSMRRLWSQAEPNPQSGPDIGWDKLAEQFTVPAGDDYLRAVMVSSIDGAATGTATSEGGPAGVSEPLSGETDRRLFRLLRGLCDGVLVGAGTIRAEGYRGVKLDDETRQKRTAAGKSSLPPIVIITNSGRFDPTSPVFVESTVPPIIVTSAAAAAGCHQDTGGLAEIVTAGETQVDLVKALSLLRAKGLHHLDCEGGPTLLGTLLAADLVDELCFTLSPVLAGDTKTRIVAGLHAFNPPRSLRLHEVMSDDGFLFLRYLVRPLS